MITKVLSTHCDKQMHDKDCYDLLIQSLLQNDSIEIPYFLEILESELPFEVEFEICKSLGIPLDIQNSRISLKIRQDLSKQIFCLVDIETSGFSHEENDIIEIAAIKYKNGTILETFESYIFAQNIPEKITEITGIDDTMLVNAPNVSQTLARFKAFLQDSVFVAHNVKFDFNFINAKLIQNKIPMMKNSFLCTLQLARKTIDAPKYGLGFLNEFLEINHPIRHRAYADCVIALKVFEQSLLSLPNNIISTQDLLDFTKMPRNA